MKVIHNRQVSQTPHKLMTIIHNSHDRGHLGLIGRRSLGDGRDGLRLRGWELSSWCLRGWGGGVVRGLWNLYDTNLCFIIKTMLMTQNLFACMYTLYTFNIQGNPNPNPNPFRFVGLVFIYKMVIYSTIAARRLVTYAASNSEFGRPFWSIHPRNCMSPFSPEQHGTLLLSM